MQHLNDLKNRLKIKKAVHKLSKEEYQDEVFKEKAKITCQFMILVITSAIFAALFHTFLTFLHVPQTTAGAAVKTAAKTVAKTAATTVPAAKAAVSNDPTKTTVASLFGLV